MDFTFDYCGTICLLHPHTPEAANWLDEHIDPDAQRWGCGIVIEPRYAFPVLEGILDAGMSITGMGLQ